MQLADVSFRRGNVSDAAEMANFATRTFAEAFSADNRPEDMAAHLAESYSPAQQAEELADSRIITTLAHANDGIIAYSQVAENPPPPCVTQKAPIELCRFYVDRRAHGTGLAMLLMEQVYQAVRELGGQHVWLGVWERNPRAIAFYKKATFFDVGSKVFMVGPDKQTDRVLVCAVPPIAFDTK